MGHIPGPDEIRRGKPAVLDEEKVIETRMEINLGTDVLKLDLRGVLEKIYKLAQQNDPAVTMGSYDKTQIWAQPQELPRFGLDKLLQQRKRENKTETTLICLPALFYLQDSQAYYTNWTFKKLSTPEQNMVESRRVWGQTCGDNWLFSGSSSQILQVHHPSELARGQCSCGLFLPR